MAVKVGTNGNIYKYDVGITILINNAAEIYNLEIKDIHYLYIDYDYINANMPWMIVNVSLDKNLLDKMIKFATTSVINITVSRFKSNTDLLGVKSVYIQEQCSYFLANDYNKNKEMDYQDINATRTDIYQNVSIGLIKVDHINKNQKLFSGILSGSSLMDSVYYCCSGLPVLIEPFKYNPLIKQLILPNLSSVATAIEFLNSRYHAFYDTPYRFFMDFKTTYLISSSGIPIPKKGDLINSVIFNVKKQNDMSGVNQGMITDLKQKVYIIDLLYGTNIEVLEDKSLDKNINTISATDVAGSTMSENLKIARNTVINSKNDAIRLNNNNTTLLKNRAAALEMASVTLNIIKTELDSSVLSINNRYSLKGDDPNTINRNGDYVLVYKKEIFTRDNDYMNLDTRMTFKKAPKQ